MFAEREDGKCHKKAIWWRAEEARVTSSYIVVGNVSGHPGCDKSCQIGHHIRNAEKSPSIIWGQFYMVQLKTKKNTVVLHTVISIIQSTLVIVYLRIVEKLVLVDFFKLPKPK